MWRCDGPCPSATNLRVIANRLDQRAKAIVAEVAISREVTPAVTYWLANSGLEPGWRIRFAPEGGPSRLAIADDGQARAWARHIGDELRRLWDKELANEVHLFVASPVEFAGMLGQQVRDRHPIYVYHGDNEAGYRLSCILGEEVE